MGRMKCSVCGRGFAMVRSGLSVCVSPPLSLMCVCVCVRTCVCVILRIASASTSRFVVRCRVSVGLCLIPRHSECVVMVEILVVAVGDSLAPLHGY